MPRKAKPNVPKNPRSAFVFFSQEERENIKRKNAQTKFEDYGRILGEMWAQLSDENKKKYQDKAKKDQQRFQDEVKKYLDSGGKKEDLKKKDRKTPKKIKKDSKGPKRACTAYIFFSKEMRPKLKSENPKASFTDLGKLIGIKWKELEEGERQKYNQLAEADKLRFEKEKGEFKEPEGSNEDDDEEEAPAAPIKKTTKKTPVVAEDDDDDDEESSGSE